jgi:hypothetical protein
VPAKKIQSSTVKRCGTVARRTHCVTPRTGPSSPDGLQSAGSRRYGGASAGAPITTAGLDRLQPGAVGVLLFEDTGTLGALRGARAGLPRAFAARAFRQPDHLQPTSRVAYAQRPFVVASRRPGPA